MKKLLLTGATGFLGKNMIPVLEKSYTLTTLGRSQKNDVQCNLSENVPALNDGYNIVLHAAGKAHVVPKTQSEKDEFYKVNLEGTKNLCKALELSPALPETFVFISTVAVYGLDTGLDITEEAPLKGETPYADSKILTERFLQEWCADKGVSLVILRLPLIAGINPPGNLGAMIRGISTGRYFSIGKAQAKKSVVMASDVAAVIPYLEGKNGIYNLTDGYDPSFGELEELISRQMNKRKPLSLPYFMAWMLAKCGDLLGRRAPINSNKLGKIVNPLTFSSVKAQTELRWTSSPVLDNFKIS